MTPRTRPPRRFLTAQWRYLLMINYEIDPAILQPQVPAGTELDFHNGKTYVSVVGFRFLDTRLRGWKVPCHVNFDEVNLRFYVRRHAEDGTRRGVVFLREVVPLWAVACTANWFYNERYLCRPMRSAVRAPAAAAPGRAEYAWRDGPRWYRLAADFHGTPAPTGPGSEEEFITEHYWGYTGQRDGSTMEYRVAHPKWGVWRTAGAEFDCDVAAFYGPQYAGALRQTPTSALVADGSAVEVYEGTRLPAGP